MNDREKEPPQSEELLREQSKRLAALNEQLARLQQQIREATQQHAEALEHNQKRELAALDTQLVALRERRQALFEQQFALRRQLTGAPEQEPLTLKQPPPPSTPPKPEIWPMMTSFIFRLLTVLVVFGGVGFLAIQLIRTVNDYLQPPPIEEVIAANEQSRQFSLFEGETIQERILSMYLVLNRDVVETPPSDDTSPVMFRIELGQTAREIAEHLQEKGLITNETVFRRLLQYRGADQSLDAGLYELRPNMTMDEIIVVLEEGRLQEITFTFLEGWRAEQMAQVLADAGVVSVEEYMALVREPSRFDYEFLRALPADSTLEGYLFPDTYILIKGQASAESIIRTQLTTFERRVTPELRATLSQDDLTLNQAIILASLVEREAVVAEERPTIAGVYLNRWRNGTVLNADPTIQYALGYQPDSGQWWKWPLTREDLQLDSIYNTYTRAGLPPGPIANPGLDAIRATILAPQTEYYYFVSRNDGTHAFAVTFEEHLQNVAQYQSGN